jgi:hypothetical protein
MSRFLLIQGEKKSIPTEIASVMIAGQVTPEYYEVLLPREVAASKGWNVEKKPSLEQIMLYHEMRGD